ncbi:MAG: hypothetical protein QOJ15_270 [Bradyrhizobium sp.]|nr:hypothetical protein [Bradyrhizobium sp.]
MLLKYQCNFLRSIPYESATSTAISSKVRETGGVKRVRGSLTSAQRP